MKFKDICKVRRVIAEIDKECGFASAPVSTSSIGYINPVFSNVRSKLPEKRYKKSGNNKYLKY